MEKLIDLAIAVIIFTIAVTDLYKGIIMSFSSRHPLLFIAQFSFGLLKLLPLSIKETRYKKAMDIYIKRKRLYGAYAIVGGIVGVMISILIILNL